MTCRITAAPASARAAAVAAVIAALACTGTVACGSSHPAPRASQRPVVPLSPAAYAHYLRGRIAMFEGDYPHAVMQFRAATSAAPTEAPVYVALIEALGRSVRSGATARVYFVGGATAVDRGWRDSTCVP